MSKTVSLFLVLLLTLTGCTQQGMSRDKPHSTLYPPPVGSRVLLQQPLEVPAGRTRVFLQHGEHVAKLAVDAYAPNCNFEVRTLRDSKSVIEPDDFMVVKVRQQTEEVVLGVPGTQLAQLVGVRYDSGLPMVTRTVHLLLGSDRQPDVMRLSCRGAFADLSEAELPSIAQIDKALGDIAQLQLP